VAILLHRTKNDRRANPMIDVLDWTGTVIAPKFNFESTRRFGRGNRPRADSKVFRSGIN